MLVPVVCAFVAIAFWPALSARALYFDDDQYLTNNPLVKNPSLDSITRFFSEVRDPSTVQAYYHPLSMTSLMADVALGGSPDNLRPFHRTSLALHLLNTALIILLLARLFAATWPAALVGLLFGLHPLTVEPLPWIGERKTLLAAFFALLCLLAYIRYARRPRPGIYLAALLCYLLALLSKPTTTLLPLVLILLDAWPLNRLSRRAVLEKLPFLALGAAFALVSVVSQDRIAYPAAKIILLTSHNILFYLGKILYPADLMPYYPFPEPLTLSNRAVLAGVIASAVLALAVLLALRKSRAPFVCTAILFVAILPSMLSVGFSVGSASDKYLYLPALGILLPLAALLTRLWNATNIRSPLPARRAILLIGVLILALLETRATRRQIAHWQSTDAIYTHVLSLAPNSPTLHYNFANALSEQHRYADAIEQFTRALELDPDHAGAHFNLANALAKTGRIGDAADHFRSAVDLNPTDAQAWNNLANALLVLGQVDNAIQHYRTSIQLDPDYARAHFNLGSALTVRGDSDQAAEHFRTAMRLDPEWPVPRRALETLHASPQTGQPQRARDAPPTSISR